MKIFHPIIALMLILPMTISAWSLSRLSSPSSGTRGQRVRRQKLSKMNMILPIFALMLALPMTISAWGVYRTNGLWNTRGQTTWNTRVQTPWRTNYHTMLRTNDQTTWETPIQTTWRTRVESTITEPPAIYPMDLNTIPTCDIDAALAIPTPNEAFGTLLNWGAWKQEHKKNYCKESHELDRYRLRVWLKNKKMIEEHNRRFNKGEVTYTLRMNKYGDLTNKEFQEKMNGYKTSGQMIQGEEFASPVNVTIPKEVDWRSKGAVTPVKDQGSCGSDWSFSAAGAIEGQIFRKSGKLVDLSGQSLIDCAAGSYGNLGCGGGDPNTAFEYLKDIGDMHTEEEYGYKGQNQKCKDRKEKVDSDKKAFVEIPSGDEEKLKEAVATVGPVSIAVDASHPHFQFYGKGVFQIPDCGTDAEKLNHAMLVVGYGYEREDNDLGEYWLVKNSWGEDWTHNWRGPGYMLIARNKGNMCGIATKASYPKL